MLKIRFQRVGRRNDPAFRVVVTERRSKPKGTGLEALGSYHPKTKETVLKNERILYWLGKGAKASPTVHNLLISKGVIQGTKINVVRPPKIVEEQVVPAAVAARETSVSEMPHDAAGEEKPVEKEPAGPEKKDSAEAPAPA